MASRIESSVTSSCSRVSHSDDAESTDLELADDRHVDVDGDVHRALRVVRRDDRGNLERISEAQGNNETYVAEERLFDASLDDSSRPLVVLDHERGGDDGRGDVLGRVDDFLDARDSERDVHRRDSSKVERLERHLRARLSNRLGADGTDGRARLDLGAHVLGPAEVEELADLRRRHLGQVVDDADGVVCRGSAPSRGRAQTHSPPFHSGRPLWRPRQPPSHPPCRTPCGLPPQALRPSSTQNRTPGRATSWRTHRRSGPS